MKLSCVIVSRNEENNISRCIESVLRGTHNIDDKEILLVDSASTDRTIDIAIPYPIDIIQLRPGWFLSASAGRFTGANLARGEYVLMIDADMEVELGWPDKALAYLEAHPETAAVRGRQLDVYEKGHGHYADPRAPRDMLKKVNDVREVPYLTGCALFRRARLIEAGNFHPYLRAEEEAEMSFRLKKAGGGLTFLPAVSVYHYYRPRNTWRDLVRGLRTNRYVGLGDLLALGVRRGYFALLWKRMRVHVLFMLAILMTVIGVFISPWFALLPLLLFALLSLRKKSVARALLVAADTALGCLFLFLGLLRRLKNPAQYPTDILWIKRTRP